MATRKAITLVSGLFQEVNLEDEILKDILTMELLVQFVESSFYIWVILALKDYKTLTQRRLSDLISEWPMEKSAKFLVRSLLALRLV